MVNYSLDRTFSNNFAHGFKSCQMSSTLDDSKNGMFCKIMMQDSKYSCADDAYGDTQEVLQKLSYEEYEWSKAVLVCCISCDSKKAHALDTRMCCSDRV